ncbi:hypothetical protein IWQ62_003806, partial [Dispira parvispora]
MLHSQSSGIAPPLFNAKPQETVVKRSVAKQTTAQGNRLVRNTDGPTLKLSPTHLIQGQSIAQLVRQGTWRTLLSGPNFVEVF